MFAHAGRKAGRLIATGLVAIGLCTPAPAFLFWTQPKLKGEKVRGDEPGIALPLKGATPKEVAANMLWAMRAGLNVAALQCQFAPALMTVDNYNKLIKLHKTELAGVITTLNGYFKRTDPKRWQNTFDQFSTKTYNGFSTLQAQLEFCETAASIGRDAQAAPDGKLIELARMRMREFRNSLTFAGDASLGYRGTSLAALLPDFGCFSDKGKPIACTKE